MLQATELELGVGQSSQPFQCAMHGTVYRCPFAYMSCTEAGDSRECNGHKVVAYLNRVREQGKLSGAAANAPVKPTETQLAPWLRKVLT